MAGVRPPQFESWLCPLLTEEPILLCRSQDAHLTGPKPTHNLENTKGGTPLTVANLVPAAVNWGDSPPAGLD